MGETARARTLKAAAWTGVAAVGALALAVLALAPLRSQGVPAPRGTDLAVVMLAHPDRLVTVDLERLRVVSSVGLRSLPLDLVVDAAGRAITSQAGGIGDEADDAVGVYDVRAGGRVRYVKLADANPTFMATVGSSVYVTHGVVYAQGMSLSVVDPASGRTVRDGYMPDTPGPGLCCAAGRLWTLALESSATADPAAATPGPGLVVTEVDPVTLRRRAVGPAHRGANGLLPLGGSLLLLRGRAGGPSASVSELDMATGAELRSLALPELTHGACFGRVVGSRVAVSEWDGLEPGDEGELVAWFDAATLQRQGSLRVPGGPCAMAAWGGRLLVVERATARLLVVDPAVGRVTGSVKLADDAPLIADVEVLTVP